MIITDELIDIINKSYEFIGKSYKKGVFIGEFENYSITLPLFKSTIDQLKNLYPNFTFTNLFLNWWIIGFNKDMTLINKNIEYDEARRALNHTGLDS